MQLLKKRIQENLPAVREKRTTLLKDKSDMTVASVAVEQIIGGMRGIPALLCDTSSVSADEGLRIRGIPILELTQHSPEEIFFLLVTGNKPNAEESKELKTIFSTHAEVPEYVVNVL